MRSVAIVAKPQKEELARILPELVVWLRQHGFEPILDESVKHFADFAPSAPRNKLLDCCPELCIVLGGDGTLLAAARFFAPKKVPLLSVNLGSLGFLTELRLSELYPTLEAWLTNSCTLERRTMLHAKLIRKGAIHAEFDALNDVVLSKGAIARMGSFTVRYQGQVAAAFRADGVIISTPTGSTAYTLSANGPILVPEMDAFVLTPVCPHLLTIRPIVFPGNAELSVVIDAVPDQTYLTVDGQEAIQIAVGDEIRCQRSEHTVQLVRHGRASNFFGVLRSKLKWSER
jgi:NAD+ kinase